MDGLSCVFKLNLWRFLETGKRFIPTSLLAVPPPPPLLFSTMGALATGPQALGESEPRTGGHAVVYIFGAAPRTASHRIAPFAVMFIF